MNNELLQNATKGKIIEFKSFKVIMDFDVASLYGVETKHVNQAVKNNPDKFPENYVLTPSQSEWENLRSKILTANSNSMSRVVPKAFTEKGLYMLATILKSKKATETSIAIIEAFANLRCLKNELSTILSNQSVRDKQLAVKKSTEIFNELMGDDLNINNTETTLEINLALLKLKHTIKKSNKK